MNFKKVDTNEGILFIICNLQKQTWANQLTIRKWEVLFLHLFVQHTTPQIIFESWLKPQQNIQLMFTSHVLLRIQML